jgi:hypothetical protein
VIFPKTSKNTCPAEKYERSRTLNEGQWEEKKKKYPVKASLVVVGAGSGLGCMGETEF